MLAVHLGGPGTSETSGTFGTCGTCAGVSWFPSRHFQVPRGCKEGLQGPVAEVNLPHEKVSVMLQRPVERKVVLKGPQKCLGSNWWRAMLTPAGSRWRCEVFGIFLQG